MKTYKTFFRGAQYGLDLTINNMDFETEDDRAEFVSSLADAISDLGLCWIPDTSEVIGPVDLDLDMDADEFSEWFDDQTSRLWESYCER